MRGIFYAMLLVGCSFALTIPNNECQNFTLFNETDNSTFNETICAGNYSIIYNVTNITISACAATNTTIWANTTLIINNQTVTCLSNATTITIERNVTSCPASNTTMTANSTQTINNQTVNCISGWMSQVPQNYCYQNIYRQTGAYSEIFRNDMCNITLIIQANQTTCQPCPSCQECLPYQYTQPCQTCETCQPQRECVRCPDTTPIEILQNRSAADALTIQNLTAQLGANEIIMDKQKNALNSIDASVDRKVEAKTGNINDLLTYTLLTCIAGAGIWVAKTRGIASPLKYGKAVTAEEVEKVMKKEGSP